MRSVNTMWERLERSFILVVPVERAALARPRRACTSLAHLTGCSVRPSTRTAPVLASCLSSREAEAEAEEEEEEEEEEVEAPLAGCCRRSLMHSL